jgi:uncharacterized membrane protein YkvA (DUF1232 family)
VSWWQWVVLTVAAVVVAWGALVGALLAGGRRAEARALGTFVPDCVLLFRRLLADDRVPRRGRIAVVLLIAYLAMPFDLVPDFIPVAGQLDDALAVALVLRLVLRSAGPGLIEEHWPGPPESLRAMLRLSGAPIGSHDGS